MLQHLRRLWHRRQRWIDQTCLFPILRAGATNPETYARSTLMHMSLNPCWRDEEADYSQLDRETLADCRKILNLAPMEPLT